MKQVCWHSRRSKAYRGLPEARMAGATVQEISSKAPPAVAKSTPTAAKLGCAFSHSAERIVDELGLPYPENGGNLRKTHGQRIAYSWFNSIKNPTKKSFLECKLTGQNGSHATARSV